MKKTTKKWRWNPVRALVSLAIAECIFGVLLIAYIVISIPGAFFF